MEEGAGKPDGGDKLLLFHVNSLCSWNGVQVVSSGVDASFSIFVSV